MKTNLGLIGIIIGLVAIGIAVFQNNLRASPVFASQEPTLKELAMDASKKLLKERVLQEKEKERDATEMPHDAVALTYMLLGFIAMILGVFSWVKKDHVRLSGGAVALGLVAVAWQWVLIGVCVAVVILLIANFG